MNQPYSLSWLVRSVCPTAAVCEACFNCNASSLSDLLEGQVTGLRVSSLALPECCFYRVLLGSRSAPEAGPCSSPDLLQRQAVGLCVSYLALLVYNAEVLLTIHTRAVFLSLLVQFLSVAI